MRVTLPLLALSSLAAALPTSPPSAVSVDGTYTSQNWKKTARDPVDVDSTYTSINWKKTARVRADVDGTYTAINWKKTAMDGEKA
ncbi:hypothetical protein PSPO01_11613 [Paraphaeosphaeria sporulosa]